VEKKAQEQAQKQAELELIHASQNKNTAGLHNTINP
jgi:hypothetical protein